jgi:hypothetical protein
MTGQQPGGPAVNAIDRTYQVRGKQVRLQELTDLAAVRSERGTGRVKMATKALDAVAPEVPLPQLRAFEDAGWAFVPRARAAGGAKVYLKSGGRVALGTNRLTVRVAGKRSEEEARELLARHGLTVVERLKFAPNLYVVEVPAGQDALEAAERLTASGDVEFAEPVLIEHLPGR